jgi:hypothetical protein
MERIVTAMRDGGSGAGARHEGVASFCLADEGTPGRGDFSVSNFHPDPIPGNLV